MRHLDCATAVIFWLFASRSLQSPMKRTGNNLGAGSSSLHHMAGSPQIGETFLPSPHILNSLEQTPDRQHIKKEKQVRFYDPHLQPIPPPGVNELPFLSVPELVNRNPSAFRSHEDYSSDPWITAFGMHPQIEALEDGDPLPILYASRFHDLYDPDTDLGTGRRLAATLKAHMKARNFDKKYQDDVLRNLKQHCRTDADRRWRNRCKERIGLVNYKAKRDSYKKPKKTLEQLIQDSAKFEEAMAKAGITEPHKMTPSELEEKTRKLYVDHYSGNKKEAGHALTTYLKVTGKSREEVKEARMIRTEYNRKQWMKAWLALNSEERASRNGASEEGEALETHFMSHLGEETPPRTRHRGEGGGEGSHSSLPMASLCAGPSSSTNMTYPSIADWYAFSKNLAPIAQASHDFSMDPQHQHESISDHHHGQGYSRRSL
ncbi:hypothetical protein CBS101457_003122 [Exobasidium rhododendri]|nr:hypothetical protein CBS101457_003122 [Exobasidium rhododendri]